ncbi:hypothetical protein BX666DRAFT_1891131 [Dichotomocladium elegans]|nr:hypothetical protein BX666DRAFT_1891131 [Dichotomocladium elegans]
MGVNQSKPPRHSRRHAPLPYPSPRLSRGAQQQQSLRPAFPSSSYASGETNSSSPNIQYTSDPPILIEDDEDEDDDDGDENNNNNNNGWPSIDFRDHHANGLLKNHFSESQLSDDLPSQPPVCLPPSLSSTTSSLSSGRTALFSTLSLTSTISSVQSIQSKYDIASPSVSVNNNSTTDDIRRQQQQQHHHHRHHQRFDADYVLALLHYHGLSTSDTPLEKKQQQQQQPNYVKARELFQKAASELRSDLLRYPEYRTEIVHIIADALYHLGEMHITGKGVPHPDSSKAMKYFESAADNGHMLAQYMVGHYSQHADNLPRAIDQYRRACLQGYVKAMAALGILLIKHHKTFPDLFSEAQKWLQCAAEKDEPTAILQLAYLYEEGKLVEKNIQHAFVLYEKYLALCPPSRVANHAELHRVMGLHYREGGTDLKTDYQAALRHLTIAADTGLASAQRSLGFMYRLGLGIPVDTHEARRLFRLAANQGDVLALGALGNLYRARRGERNEALECYRLAAKSGFPPALMSLANLLVELDRPDEAEEVLRRLIADPSGMYYSTALLHLGLLRRDVDLLQSLNDPTADYNLGQMASSRDNALAHYIRAAKAGHVEAMYQCADILANHRKDPASAYHWYTQAANRGHPMAQVCEALYYMNGLPPVRTRDYPRAEGLLRQAVRKKPNQANVHLATVLMEKDPSEARSRFLSAAQAGNTTAMRHLASMLDQDKHEQQQAFLWLQKAADLKDPRAMVTLSEHYEKGRWCDKGETGICKALECLKEAEALGYTRASFNIATLYERQSLWKNAADKYDSIAAKFPIENQYGWFARLLKHRLVVLHQVGDVAESYRLLQAMIKHPRTPESLIEPYELLGMCCENDRGIQCDLAKATQWYEKAIQVTIKDGEDADLNQERVRCRLASLYFKQGKHEAAFSCLRALEPHLDKMRSHSSSETVTQAREARFLLGYLLLHQSEPDVSEAKRWLAEAADQGHLEADYELGKLALRENDHAEARYWFEKGDYKGNASSKREMALLLLQDGMDDSTVAGTIRCLLDEAIDMGDMDACFELGKLYETNPKGLFPSENHRAAFNLYVKAGKQGGHRLARIAAGEVLYYDDHREQDALVWFELESDHWFSQFRMFMITQAHSTNNNKIQYLETLLPPEPPETDTHERLWWCKAAYSLGQCAPDDEVAIRWYTRAADLLHRKYVPAMLALANLYLDGRKDEVNALEWYRHAADQHDVTALYKVGLFHREGKAGLEKNVVAAATYLKKAALKDHPDATFRLGEAYWEMRDYKKGWKAYKDAADKHGCLPALQAVGFLYDRGFSMADRENKPFTITKDKNKAITYFCRAAKMDDIDSMIMLGQYHEKNPTKALGYYRRAEAVSSAQETNPLLDFVLGRLFHLMANDSTNELQRNEHHRTAYQSLQRAVTSSAQDDRGVRIHAEMLMTLYHLYDWYPPVHDPAKALRALLKMEQDADPESIVSVKENLAYCYEKGVGTEKNIPLALAQWKSLCEHGVRHALAAVEEYHRDGLATDTDLQIARQAFQASQGKKKITRLRVLVPFDTVADDLLLVF